MSLIDDIKNQVKKSGSNKGKFLYFKPGTKIRVRFLADMDDGAKFLFHDSFALSINVPCQDIFGRECPHCDSEELRHRDQYCWSVWDYEAKEVKLLLAAVNNCSPIPALIAMYDTYGTLTDRDFVITKQGSGQSTAFSVVPMDKVKFRNEKAKKYSESKVLDFLDKAFPSDDEQEDEAPARTSKPKPGTKPKPKPKTKPAPVDDDEDDGDLAGNAYELMTPRELYALCKEKEIEAKPKQTREYYIELIEEAEEDWGEDDESGDWDE